MIIRGSEQPEIYNRAPRAKSTGKKFAPKIADCRNLEKQLKDREEAGISMIRVFPFIFKYFLLLSVPSVAIDYFGVIRRVQNFVLSQAFKKLPRGITLCCSFSEFAMRPFSL
jgi:hypothetical protein